MGDDSRHPQRVVRPDVDFSFETNLGGSLMFVHRLRPMTQSALAIAAALTMSACEDPVAQTDLRPEGSPEVLAVLVFNDLDNGIIERATFCKPNDPKRPGNVAIGELFET